MNSKICKKCSTDLPVSSFILIGVRKDGKYRYTTNCRECRNQINSEYMRKRREDPVFIQKEKEYLKQYCDKNRKEVWEIIYNSNPKPRVEYTEEGKKAKAEQLEQAVKVCHEIYRERNKDIINAKRKDNEALKKYKAELVMCECGQEYRRDGISRHRKTELHTKRLNLSLIHI